MRILKWLKFVRLRENLIRNLPLAILVINFYYTINLHSERDALKLEYDSIIANSQKIEDDYKSEELKFIKMDKLRKILILSKKFNYSKMDVNEKIAVFEFTEDSLNQAKSFEMTIKNQGFKCDVQVADGEENWNIVRIEVEL